MRSNTNTQFLHLNTFLLRKNNNYNLQIFFTAHTASYNIGVQNTLYESLSFQWKFPHGNGKSRQKINEVWYRQLENKALAGY